MDKLDEKYAALCEQADQVKAEAQAAGRRRDYLAANPDLPETHTDPIPGVD